jgi:phosphoribosylanthranilate isomerase
MSARTRIKICGVSRSQDVEAAVDAGADAIGFVFHPGSPRCVTLDQATALARELPPFVTPVGLFVNAAPGLVAAAVAALPQLVLQFHGDESATECAAPGRPFLKAARMTPGFDLLDFAARFSMAQGLLLDTHAEGYGGSGKVFDWSLVPRGVPHRLVLSGGLHAGNVGSGIRELRPWAVDVSSGVESSRGVKDAAAIRRFCDAVREADSRIDASIS